MTPLCLQSQTYVIKTYYFHYRDSFSGWVSKGGDRSKYHVLRSETLGEWILFNSLFHTNFLLLEKSKSSFYSGEWKPLEKEFYPLKQSSQNPVCARTSINSLYAKQHKRNRGLLECIRTHSAAVEDQLWDNFSILTRIAVSIPHYVGLCKLQPEIGHSSWIYCRSERLVWHS